MAILPTRDSTDTNSAADVNALSTEALDTGGTSQLSALTEEASPASGDWYLLEKSTGELRKVDSDNVGGSGKGDYIIDIPAGKWWLPASNPAPLDTDSGTNGTIKRNLFDDTTEEFIEYVIEVPSDVDTSGTVTFDAYGYASTADGNEIQLRFSHIAIADSESWDQAYNTVDSGDLTTDGTQDDLDYFTWNETISNLGWAANDFVRIKLSRISIDDGSALSGDWGLTHFKIRIPRT